MAELEAQAAREVNWLQRLAVQQIRGVDGRQAENLYILCCLQHLVSQGSVGASCLARASSTDRNKDAHICWNSYQLESFAHMFHLNPLDFLRHDDNEACHRPVWCSTLQEHSKESEEIMQLGRRSLVLAQCA